MDRVERENELRFPTFSDLRDAHTRCYRGVLLVSTAWTKDRFRRSCRDVGHRGHMSMQRTAMLRSTVKVRCQNSHGDVLQLHERAPIKQSTWSLLPPWAQLLQAVHPVPQHLQGGPDRKFGQQASCWYRSKWIRAWTPPIRPGFERTHRLQHAPHARGERCAWSFVSMMRVENHVLSF